MSLGQVKISQLPSGGNQQVGDLVPAVRGGVTVGITLTASGNVVGPASPTVANYLPTYADTTGLLLSKGCTISAVGNIFTANGGNLQLGAGGNQVQLNSALNGNNQQVYGMAYFPATTSSTSYTLNTTNMGQMIAFTASTAATVTCAASGTLVVGSRWFLVNNTSHNLTVAVSGGDTLVGALSLLPNVSAAVIYRGTGVFESDIQYTPSPTISGPASVTPGAPVKWVLPGQVAVGTLNSKTWWVDSVYGSDSNSGSSINDPFQTLPHALSVATADAYGDTIFLAKGFLVNDGAISITKSCNIVSLGATANEPARFGNGTVITITGNGNMDVSFTGCAFVPLNNIPIIVNDAVSGPTGVGINFESCRFNYSYTSGNSGPAINAQIQLNGFAIINGNNNVFAGTVAAASTITRNCMIQLGNVNIQQGVYLKNSTYLTTRITAGVSETFIYSQNTAPQTVVELNGFYHNDTQGTSDSTIADVFMRDTGCAHNINVTNYTFKETYSTSPSTNPIVRLGNSNNAVAGTGIFISNVLVDYGPLSNAQIVLGNATSADDIVLVVGGIFYTNGTYQLTTAGSGKVAGTYFDGAGILHTPAPTASTFTGQTTLVINHNLNKTPVNVLLTDGASPPNELLGYGVQFTTANQLTISFSGATSGIAYIS